MGEACRGTSPPYPWSNKYVLDQLSVDSLANFKMAGLGTVNDVISFPMGSSQFGALNMLGNLREWTSDEFTNQYGNSARSYRSGSFDDGPQSTMLYRSPV